MDEKILLQYGLFGLLFLLIFLFTIKSKFNGKFKLNFSCFNNKKHFKLEIILGSIGKDNAACQEQDQRQNCSPTELSAEPTNCEALRVERPRDGTCSDVAGRKLFGDNKPEKYIEKSE